MIVLWIIAVVFGLIGLIATAWYMRDEYFYTGRIFGYTLGTGLLWGLIALGIVGILSDTHSEPAIDKNVVYEYTTLRGEKGIAKTCDKKQSGALICETTNHTTILVESFREVEIRNED